MVARSRPTITVDEYFAIEQHRDERPEYFDGVVVLREGASLRHDVIQGNLSVNLEPHLRRSGCQILGSTMRIIADGQRAFCYPDLAVICGTPELLSRRPDTVLNPVLLVEILSPETELLDRSKKWHRYTKISSLRDYLLVAQDAPSIEHFFRRDDGQWYLHPIEGLSATITLPTLGCTLPFAEIYRQVDFASAPDDEG